MGSLQASGKQITLFYSGIVNVYDDVPAHKARAIMLLLSDHCSRNSTSVTDWGKDLSMQTLQPHDLSKIGVSGSCAKASCPPLQPPTPSTSTADNVQISQFTKKQHPIISKRSQAELPFARKASLARFLEKRKDRVLEAMKVNEEVGASTEGSDIEALDSPCSKRMKHSSLAPISKQATHIKTGYQGEYSQSYAREG